ncbi:UDP-glucose--hexose-1-phosphate uridylyltransferase [Marinoscillum furvescens]|uniref:Galactose-1-phosphate uridylyltransferase n=1 Tax=Marinoscillum furvescens DSM 4134 TaxID=1122208 RepID=A0A3D9L543_MARFU|nr:UDP-glucose--hexose-1-phosphate uridylyltransferase [Marinoscillum furvescens]REE01155.1 UDPglucose--hexose-1-phosphate uridylyltransferase [Marinoscillum furvescens DSM 4134]
MPSTNFEKPHKRYNILTDEWVLVSPHRTKRPWQGKVEDVDEEQRPQYDPKCYLCPGNERMGGAVNPQYKDTFVFQNDFAALMEDQGTAEVSEGLLRVQEERGTARVICFSPDHSLTMPEMSVDALAQVVKVWKREFADLAKDPQISNVQIFENKGPIMGCSNPHPHGQIWAQSSVPNEIAKRTATQVKHFAETGKSLLGEYLFQELEAGERIVCENDYFVCLVPFWAVWPYETMIVPRRHFQAVTDMTEQEELAFAEILSKITIRYDNLFKCSFPYSAGMQQRPTDDQDYSGWHFHYSFYPPLLRSATVKKFMVGYEMFANPQRDITAEMAAKTLRELPEVHYKQAMHAG